MATNRGGVDDMVEMPAIAEKDIAENLRVRLQNETIYVSNVAHKPVLLYSRVYFNFIFGYKHLDCLNSVFLFPSDVHRPCVNCSESL